MGFHLAAIVLVLNKPQTQTTLVMPTLNDADSLSSPRDRVFQEPVGRERTALLEHCPAGALPCWSTAGQVTTAVFRGARHKNFWQTSKHWLPKATQSGAKHQNASLVVTKLLDSRAAMPSKLLYLQWLIFLTKQRKTKPRNEQKLPEQTNWKLLFL